MRRGAVEQVTGLSRSGIYELMADRRFPRPVRLGPKSVAWRESEVAAWQRARIAERDAQTPAPKPDAQRHAGRPDAKGPDISHSGCGHDRPS